MNQLSLIQYVCILYNVHPVPVDWYTLPPWLRLDLKHPIPWRWLDWYTLPLTLVGFETPCPGAIVGLVHPAPGYGWI